MFQHKNNGKSHNITKRNKKNYRRVRRRQRKLNGSQQSRDRIRFSDRSNSRILIHQRFDNCWNTKVYNENNIYNDHIRLTGFQLPYHQPHYVPRWILYTTSNYLHANGWSSYISKYSNFSYFYNEHFLLFDYYTSYICNFSLALSPLSLFGCGT